MNNEKENQRKGILWTKTEYCFEASNDKSTNKKHLLQITVQC